MSSNPTLAEIIAKAAPVERIVPLCVAGDLVAEFERLQHEMDEMPPSSGRLGGDPRAAIADKLVEIQKQMRERTFEFRFRALSPKAWSDLVAAHPDKSGQKRMFDPKTFADAAIAACCVSPEGMDDDEQRAALMENLSTAQQGQLFDAAWDCNVMAPKGLSSSIPFAALPNSETS